MLVSINFVFIVVYLVKNVLKSIYILTRYFLLRGISPNQKINNKNINIGASASIHILEVFFIDKKNSCSSNITMC